MKKDKEALVSQNIGLVHFVIKRFSGRGQDMEELFQVGCVGLCKAVEGFDETLELRFSTYAVPVILGEVRRFVRDNTQVHISRGIKEQSLKIKYAREQYESKYHREPTVQELSEITGIDAEDILLAGEVMRPAESLDTFIHEEENGTSKIDLLCGGYNTEEQALNRILCEDAFKRMSSKEQEIVYMRFFHDMTQANVADKLNMTQVQVSRMEKKLLLRLREELGKS